MKHSVSKAMIAVALATAAVVAVPQRAAAAPIPSHVVGCIGETCIAAPDGGPVAVDPTGFTLEALWPDYIELLENPGGGHWLMKVLFQYTGTHDGTESMGQIQLLDKLGAPIAALNVQFDDLNPLEQANYEIFGPLNQPFKIYGFQLALSDGSGVDTLDWVAVSFSPARIPEPSMLLLAAAGLGVGLLRHRRR